MHSIARQKSSDFHEILCTAADIQLDEHHVIKNEEVALDRLRVSCLFIYLCMYVFIYLCIYVYM